MRAFPSPCAGSRSVFCGVAVFVLFVAPAAQAQQNAGPEEGLLIAVRNPISDTTVDQIKQAITQARGQPERPLKKVVFDFNPKGTDADSPNYGSCYTLADEIRKLSLNGVATIAFVHGKTTRHSVLPVLACNDLVMSSDAKIGEVAEANAPLRKSQLDYYVELAGPTRAAFVQKMIDSTAEIMLGLVPGGATVYFDKRQPPPNVINPQPVPGLGAGSIALYQTDRAVQYGLARLTLDSPQAIEEHYNVTLRKDLLGGRAPKACKIEVIGQVDDALREKLRRQLEEARGRKENHIFFVIDCGGGDAKAARDIADDLKALLSADEPVRTIAFVRDKAPDLAAFIALACSEVVMYKGPAADNEAVLGDFETYIAGAKAKEAGINPDFVKRNLLEVTQDRYPAILIEGMFDRDLVIVRAWNQKTDERRLMTRQEADQLQAQGWQTQTTIKERGTLLKLNATRAKELRVATATVDGRDINAVYSLYGLEAKDVRDARPHWLDSFAAFLRRTEVSILLILIGIGGLILELKVPGMTVPGIIAALCFVLFFWSQSQLSGQLIWLAVLLFLLGLVLIGIEIFVLPGFGVTGVSGILLVIGGLGLAAFDRIPQTSEDWVSFGGRVMQYGLAMVAAATLALMFARYLPKIPYANRLMLIPPTDKPDATETTVLPGFEQAAALLGATGTATSTLRPAGMAKFGEVFVDVVTEGEFISPGTPIQVIEVEGTRIVVKAI
jgi:membrane-bound serine protease (ClpP class)